MTGMAAIRTAVVVTLGLLVAVSLNGVDRGIAMYVAALVAGGLAVAFFQRRIRTRFPTPVPLEQLLQRPTRHTEGVMELDALSRRIDTAANSAFEVHFGLRPMLRQLAATRLAGRHGIDLDDQPERSRALIGEQLWELVRPDRQPPDDRFAKGLTPSQVGQLIDQLEAI